jgi:hypothetical protein
MLHMDDTSPVLGTEIRALLRWLDVRPDEVEWVVPYSAGSGFDVHRLDDNGNHALMGNYPCRAAAAFWVAEYESRGHKQTYWFEESSSHASRTGG